MYERRAREPKFCVIWGDRQTQLFAMYVQFEWNAVLCAKRNSVEKRFGEVGGSLAVHFDWGSSRVTMVTLYTFTQRMVAAESQQSLHRYFHL